LSKASAFQRVQATRSITKTNGTGGASVAGSTTQKGLHQ